MAGVVTTKNQKTEETGRSKVMLFIKKTAYSLFVLLSIATIVFFLFSASFPDPGQMVVGERTDEATKEAIKAELGLNKTVWQQYLLYINDLSPVGKLADGQKSYIHIYGNIYLKPVWLRRSFQSGKPVTSILADALPGTIVLAIASMFLATIFGIISGIISALKVNKWPDRLLLIITTAGISVPSFFSAIVFAWLFAFVLQDITHLPLTGSLFDYHPIYGRTLQLQNLILPALALGIRPLSVISQLTRNSMLDELNKDYIRTARAKGLSGRQIIWKHAMRNAINPVITSLTGWFASLLAGAFFVEYVFNWKGIGKLTIEALEKSDLPLLMGSVLLVATVFVIMNLLVDVLYKWIDPRIKSS